MRYGNLPLGFEHKLMGRKDLTALKETYGSYFVITVTVNNGFRNLIFNNSCIMLHECRMNVGLLRDM